LPSGRAPPWWCCAVSAGRPNAAPAERARPRPHLAEGGQRLWSLEVMACDKQGKPLAARLSQDSEQHAGTGFRYRLPQLQASSHLVGWPVTCTGRHEPSVSILGSHFQSVSTRNGRSRPFFLIPTPGSESRPAIGGTFHVRLAGGPFFHSLRLPSRSFFFLWGFGILFTPVGARGPGWCSPGSWPHRGRPRRITPY
jgi:hypothetical protein